MNERHPSVSSDLGAAAEPRRSGTVPTEKAYVVRTAMGQDSRGGQELVGTHGSPTGNDLTTDAAHSSGCSNDASRELTQRLSGAIGR